HEEEQFPPADWEFIRWLAEISPKSKAQSLKSRAQNPQSSVQNPQAGLGGRQAAGEGRERDESLVLSELDLLQWLARWGHTSRLELASANGAGALEFHGQVAELTPHLEPL